MPEQGDIVFIDGERAAIVVGTGVDADNVRDQRVFVAELGDVTVIEPNEDGAYNFGSSPYDKDAHADPTNPAGVNPGGFGPDTPLAVAGDAHPVAPAAPDTIGDGGYDPENAVVRDARATEYDRVQDDRVTELEAREARVAERERELAQRGAWGSTTTPPSGGDATQAPTATDAP